MTPEGKVKKKIIEILKTIRITEPLWFQVIEDKFNAGIPDIMGCFYGRFFSIEAKRPGGKARPLQVYVKSQIEHSQGFAIVADSVEDVMPLLERIRHVEMERN